MLGKLPVSGGPTILITVGQGPTALAVGAGGGCLDISTLIYPFSSLSPSLWETARYRLKYCLKGPLNPKQPTNQPRHRKKSPNKLLKCTDSSESVYLSYPTKIFILCQQILRLHTFVILLRVHRCNFLYVIDHLSYQRIFR